MFNFNKALEAFLADEATNYASRLRDYVYPMYGLSWKEAVALVACASDYSWPEDVDDARADDIISEIADNEVSVYTFGRYQWAAEHFGRVDLTRGGELTDSRDPADIIAAAWYEANADTLRELIDGIAKEYASEGSAA